MVRVERYPVGQLKANCYIMETKNSIFVIDPGSEADFLSEKISSKQKPLEAIFLTHGHFDHVLGAMDLKLVFGAPIHANNLDEKFLKRARETALFYKLSGEALNPRIDVDLKNVSQIERGLLDFKILKTPGHTPGSVSFFLESEGILFCGDLMFADGNVGFYRGRSDAKKLSYSIEKILKLPKNVIVYPGHGDQFQLGKMTKYFKLLIENGFLSAINN